MAHVIDERGDRYRFGTIVSSMLELGQMLDAAKIMGVTPCKECCYHNTMIDHGVLVDCRNEPKIMHAKPMSDRTSWQEWTDICRDHDASAIVFPPMYFDDKGQD